jgi:hypothetical protein
MGNKEMFDELTATLLKAEPTKEGAVEMVTTLAEAVACVIEAFGLLGIPARERLLRIVDAWGPVLTEDEYEALYPYDEFVLRIHNA